MKKRTINDVTPEEYVEMVMSKLDTSHCSKMQKKLLKMLINGNLELCGGKKCFHSMWNTLLGLEKLL